MQEIEHVIQNILNSYSEQDRWPVDITDRVFCVIESNPDLLRIYQAGVETAGRGNVNRYIGKRVKQLTKTDNLGRSYSHQSSLIQSYEQHG